MPAERYFLATPFEEDASVSLEEKEAHHLIRVMRAQPGEAVELVNGLGQLAQATVVECHKKRADLRIDKVVEKPKPAFRLILAQAIPRTSRLEMIVEKGTELGMSELWLFLGQRSERKQFGDKQADRVKAIMIAAMKQCGRLDLPELKLMPALEKWDSLSLPAFYGDVMPDAPTFSSAWQQTPPKEGCLFFVGPESGFTESETTKMQQMEARGVKLHDNILRTDTAPIVALSLIQHWQLCSTLESGR